MRARDLGRMANSVVVGMSVGGALGAAAGRVGSAVLARLRRGVRAPGWCCEGAVAVLWALVGARAGAGGLPVWWAPVPLLLAWFGVLLGVCDLLARRLPDALTLPAHGVLLAAVGAAAVAGGPARMVPVALVGGGLFAGIYLLVRLIAPRSLGAGDVKLAGALGLALGPVAPLAVPLSVAASAVLALLHGGLARARARRRRPVPHGPAMLLPAWLLTAAGPPPV